MRSLVLAILLTLPLAAQFRVANLSNQNLEEMKLWEQYTQITKQIRDLCIAGETSGGPYDVASEVAQTFREQMKLDYPTLGKLILSGDHTRGANADITCHKARIMWDGWDYAEPDANPAGTTHSVCASGCDFSTIQSCIDAMAFGDVCELAAGETYGGDTTQTVFTLPDQHDFKGFCPYYSVIQVEDYAANFTPGVAALETDAANMAKIVGGDPGSFFEKPIKFEADLISVDGGDAGADTITTGSAHGFNVGDKLVWVYEEHAPNQWWSDATGEMDKNLPWYVVATPTSTTLQLSATPGGAPFNITAVPSSFNVSLRKFDRPVACWRIRGLEVTVPVGEGRNQEMIQLSSVEPILEATASHNIVQHVWVHGHPSQAGVVGPQIGIRMDGRNVAIRDSTVTDLLGSHNPSASEGKAVVVGRAYGPVWMENLRLAGAMNAVGVGFVGQFVEYHYPGSNGGVVNKNIYAWKEPNWFVNHRSAANPVEGAWCHPGMVWQNQTGPVCYTCGVGGTWGSTPDANCNNFNDLTIKNMWEIKHGTEALLWNFWGELSPFGDLNQEYWLTIKASNSNNEWHNARFIGYNFRTRWTNAGALLRGSVSGGSVMGVTLGPQALWQGLSTEVDGIKFAYESGTANAQDGDYIHSVGSTDTWQQIRHVTQTGYSDSQAQKFLTAKSGSFEFGDRAQWGLSVKDNIFQGDGAEISGGGTSDCTPLTQAVVTSGTTEWEHNLTFGYTAPNPGFGGCSTVFWNETAGANVGFADYANGDMELTGAGTGGDYRAGGSREASDGRDLGVDFEILDDGMGGRDGAGVKAGIGGWSQQFDVSITAVSATTATVEWDRPNSANACTLTLYTDYPRSAAHGDTFADNTDSRTGNTVVAGHVTFNLGTNTPLDSHVWYWFEIDCPTDSVHMVGSFFTE